MYDVSLRLNVKIRKEERQFSKEVNSLFKRLEKSNNDIEKELYAEK